MVTNDELINTMATIRKFINWQGVEKVEILIDTDTYYRLKEYADKIGEPLSMVATNAIKNYLKNME